MADEHVMSNYFPVAVGHAGHQWLVSLLANYFDSWQELKQAFIDNFIATCEQPGNKYDLQRIRDRKDEPLQVIFVAGLLTSSNEVVDECLLELLPRIKVVCWRADQPLVACMADGDWEVIRQDMLVSHG